MTSQSKKGPEKISLTILLKPELSEHHLKVEYGKTPSELRAELAKKLGVAPQRIRLFIKRPDNSELDITHLPESVGSLIERYGNVWYATIEEPYGSSMLINAIEKFRNDYMSSNTLKMYFKPLVDDEPGYGIFSYLECKKDKYCVTSKRYLVSVLPSVGYPLTEPLIFVSPKIWHKCCFYNLTPDYFRNKAYELPELSASLERLAVLVESNINACVMHIESWDYIRQNDNPLEVMLLALCTDVGLCYSKGS